MRRKTEFVCVLLLFSLCLVAPPNSQASINQDVNARSAILVEMESGRVLFEQNADRLIAPASITKILTLYLVFDAIRQGRVRLSDKVKVSGRAACTGGSRMGLKAGTLVSMEELIRGIAVVSGNDACVAVAEYISGSVEQFVRKMNVKARQLGMTRSHFMTPNGLPAEGQLTTARDIAKLSVAYLRRFPESLAIHSMQSYTYGNRSRHNANRLLGKCPGVDGLKTGFVCSSGYNISATAKRDQTRIIAVVMGAGNPWIRCSEAEKLIEAGFRETGAPYHDLKNVAHKTTARKSALNASKKKVRNAAGKTTLTKQSTPGNGKTPSRHTSANKKPPAPVSEEKKNNKSVSHARALKKRPKG